MIKKRKPFLALLLAIIPGLGQLYNGQAQKAGILALIDFILLLSIYYTQFFMSVISILILMTILIGTFLYRLIDAFIVARKNPHYELKKYNTWYFYLLFVAAISIFHAIVDITKINTIQSFKIPSGAMEPTIQIGDRLIAQIGFYKNNSINRNDIVVFHYPAETNMPIDEKTHYVSRCVAIAGDTFSIRNKQVYINSQTSSAPLELKYKFKCFTNNILSEGLQKKYGISSENIYTNELLTHQDKTFYLIDLKQSTVDSLRKKRVFDSIVDFKLEELDATTILFPYAYKSLHWTVDNYGPLWVPKAGVTIQLTPDLVEIYGQTIEKYEGHEKVEFSEGKLIIDNKLMSFYTFKQNYCFTMGDNRHSSADGRYWGFVPEDHLAGKAWVISYSYDPDLSFPENVRKERFFMPLK